MYTLVILAAPGATRRGRFLEMEHKLAPRLCNKEILTAMRVMVVSIGSRGSHIPAMTPRRLRRGVIGLAGM